MEIPACAGMTGWFLMLSSGRGIGACNVGIPLPALRTTLVKKADGQQRNFARFYPEYSSRYPANVGSFLMPAFRNIVR